MRKVNDAKIYKNKFYPWYYTEKLDINMVPISYYTRVQAELTLKNQFGNTVLKRMHIIKGSDAIREGMSFGKNTFWWEGKRYQVKKYFFPTESSICKSRRRKYARSLKRLISNHSGRSGRTALLNKFFYKTYGTKFR